HSFLEGQSMKKTLALLAMGAFTFVVAAPAFAQTATPPAVKAEEKAEKKIEKAEEKKAEKVEKAEKKAAKEKAAAEKKAAKTETDPHLLLEELQHAHDAWSACRRESEAGQASKAYHVRAHRDRLHDVGPAREAAVDDHLRPPVHGLEHLRKDVHRASAVIELASSVVGDVDHVHAVLHAERRVFGGGDALQAERDLVRVLEVLDEIPRHA